MCCVPLLCEQCLDRVPWRRLFASPCDTQPLPIISPPLPRALSVSVVNASVKIHQNPPVRAYLLPLLAFPAPACNAPYTACMCSRGCELPAEATLIPRSLARLIPAPSIPRAPIPSPGPDNQHAELEPAQSPAPWAPSACWSARARPVCERRMPNRHRAPWHCWPPSNRVAPRTLPSLPPRTANRYTPHVFRIPSAHRQQPCPKP